MCKNKNEYVEWLKDEYEKAEKEGRLEDMDMIAKRLESEENFF